MKPSQNIVIRRAALPEVLFPGDAAVALQVTEAVAEASMVSGAFGPAFTVDGRPAVLRDAFLAALARRASVRIASREEVIRPTAESGSSTDPRSARSRIGGETGRVR